MTAHVKLQPLTVRQREFVEANKPLAYRIANQIYLHNPYLWKYETLQDARQNAVLCLCRSVSRGLYDPDKGCFSTYLRKIVYNELCRRGLECGLIHVPGATKKSYREDAKKARAIRRASNVHSLSLGYDCVDVRGEASRQMTVEDALSSLDARSKRVIVGFFGLGGQPRKNLSEIAKSEYLTAARVHKIKADALKKIRLQYLA